MLLITNIAGLQEVIRQARASGKTIGFVPTMGALHEGHLELVRHSLAETGLTVVSIFVNPTQFNDSSDFKHYPRTLEADTALLEKTGCHVLFVPEEEEMYPDAGYRKIDFDPGDLALRLEGAPRPGHFAGMAAVVKRFFDIVQPDKAYFGQKDYQQYRIVESMAAWYKLPLQLVMHPIVREPGGLAMSSRNRRLSTAARTHAAHICRILQKAADSLKSGLSPLEVKAQAAADFQAAGNFQLDYFDICSAETLRPVTELKAGQKLLLCTAAVIEGIRLIDNIVVG